MPLKIVSMMPNVNVHRNDGKCGTAAAAALFTLLRSIVEGMRVTFCQ